MKIAPPTSAKIDQAVAAVERSLRATVRRRRIGARVGIGAAALAALGIAGTGAATAFFPQYYDLQGVVKTLYVEDFVDCIRAAGWDAEILSPAEAAPILDGWGVDPATNSVTTHHLLQSTQGQAGRAITTCQEDLSAAAGEPIMAEQ